MEAAYLANAAAGHLSQLEQEEHSARAGHAAAEIALSGNSTAAVTWKVDTTCRLPKNQWSL